ncbi:hypothetical protein TWF730_003702 [Orbilia blumenaviensis]|uniref:Uncharacterized protein n=1 Tax=Orbilia blumenaviensis TaxID=1796055 RepID=A0AAV9U7B0_9PEZI
MDIASSLLNLPAPEAHISLPPPGNYTELAYPPATTRESIYESAHPSRDRKRLHPIPPKSRLNLSNHFIPWDGTLPTQKISPNTPFPPRHWLHLSPSHHNLKTPFSAGYQDPEPAPLEFPHRHPRPLRPYDTSNIRYTIPSSAAFASDLGTIVIPRHHNSTDLLLLISQSSTTTAPPQGTTALLARFLVCSRTVLHYIPAMRGQASHNPVFQDGQEITLPDNAGSRIFPFFLLQLPKVDLTSLWLILTILHHRYPIAWCDLDLPFETVYNLAKTLHILEMDETEGINIIKSRLCHTLSRHAEGFKIPADKTPNLGKWVFIAHTFGIEEGYSQLWANMVATTWRFTEGSIAVDRYTNPNSSRRNSSSTIPSIEKYGNYYWTDALSATLKTELITDRARLLTTIRNHWACFRSRYHLPGQQAGSFADILSATKPYDGSAMDLRDHILAYADNVSAVHQQMAAVSGRGLNPNVMADVGRIKAEVEGCFDVVEGRDTAGNRIWIPREEYLSPQHITGQTPRGQGEGGELRTPPELDDLSPLHHQTMYVYQSGELVYWRNHPPPAIRIAPATPYNTIFSRVRLSWSLVAFLVFCAYTEAMLYVAGESTSVDSRVTPLLLWGVYYLTKVVVFSRERERRMREKEEAEERELERTAKAFKWVPPPTSSNGTGTGTDNAASCLKGTVARNGLDWTRYTPLEAVPENLLHLARREAAVGKFREERARRWRREGRDRWGRLPGERGYGVVPLPPVLFNVHTAEEEEEERRGPVGRVGYGLHD